MELVKRKMKINILFSHCYKKNKTVSKCECRLIKVVLYWFNINKNSNNKKLYNKANKRDVEMLSR